MCRSVRTVISPISINFKTEHILSTLKFMSLKRQVLLDEAIFLSEAFFEYTNQLLYDSNEKHSSYKFKINYNSSYIPELRKVRVVFVVFGAQC